MSRIKIKEPDLKRLFAESGNLCAFPKCSQSIIEGGSTIGEICHIKGANSGSARFDATESDQFLNSYENLILLCRNHHKSVDDDEISYTVSRLKNMKAAHIKNSKSKIKEDDANLMAKIYLENTVTSKNQSGGLTANTINAQSLHVHASPTIEIPAHTVKAIAVLWTAILALEKEFGSMIVLHSILTPEEIKSHVESEQSSNLTSQLFEPFRNSNSFQKKALLPECEEADKQQPFISEVAFKNYKSIYTILCRLGAILHISLVEKRYRDWMTDDYTIQLLCHYFTIDQRNQCMSQSFNSLKSLIEISKQQFLQVYKG